MDLERIKKIEEALNKELEILEKLKEVEDLKFKKGYYTREEYLELKNEIILLTNHITKILSLIEKYKKEHKLANSNIPVISHYYKLKRENRAKQINRFLGDKIIIKRKLHQKLKEKNSKKRKDVKDFISKEKKKRKVRKAISLTNLKSFDKLFNFFLNLLPDFYLWIYNYLRKFDLTPFQRNLLSVVYILSFFLLSYLSVIFLALSFLFFMKKISLEFFKKTLLFLTFLGVLVIMILLTYPFYSFNEKRRKINAYLPFALIHMAAISSSGINFYYVIKMIAETKDYKDLAEEFQKIISLVEEFNMSLTDALKLVGEQTPSDELADILRSIVYLTKSGGDITNYLQQKSQEAILEYKYNKEKYTSSLDVFSDLYVILVVAIPLLFVSTISILSSFSSSPILEKIAKLGTYILIPFLNLMFILILKMSGRE